MTRYDTFDRRLVAAFLDGVLLSLFEWIHGALVPPGGTPLGAAFASLLSMGVAVAYSVGMHGCFGRTVGKMIVGVVVLDVSEKRNISFRQAWRRDIGLIALCAAIFAYEVAGSSLGFDKHYMALAGSTVSAASIAWFLLEVVTMLSNEKRRALHDWIADTVVVRTTDATWMSVSNDEKA